MKLAKIIIGILIAVIIIVVIWGIGANNKIQKLQNDYNVEKGKNIVHEMNIQKLYKAINDSNTSYALYHRKTDSLIKGYVKKVDDRDKIIDKYKKEHQSVFNLSDIKSIEYFNNKIGSVSPVVVIPPDTTFAIPVEDIKKANGIFVEKDKLTEINENYKRSEIELLKINQNLNVELNNRIGSIKRLTEIVSEKDNIIVENNKQINDLNKIIKKEKRKATIQKIGIGVIGLGGIVLAIIL